jgi:outer membrane protein
MKSSTIKFLSATALLWLAAFNAQAQDLKIGYVNRDRVMSEMNLFKAADAKFRAEFAKREKEILDFEARLKALQERFEKDAPTLAETERNRRQRELVQQDREYQLKRRAYQDDLTQRQQEELSVLYDRAAKAVKQIQESEKYDLILNQEGVFHASSKIDITDKVIKILNAQSVK